MSSDPSDDLGVIVGHFDADEHDVDSYLVHPDTVDAHFDKLAGVIGKVRETDAMPRGKVLPVPRMELGVAPITLGESPDKSETPDYVLPYIYK